MSGLRGALAVAVLSIGLLSSGCMTSGQASKLAQQTAAPGWEMAEAGDLMFCVAAFHRKSGRWPSDYQELARFIERSNGYLALMRQYEQVELTKKPADGLEIRYTVAGVSHRVTFAPTEVAAAGVQVGMTPAEVEQVMRGSGRERSIVKDGEETIVKYDRTGDYFVFVDGRLTRHYRHGDQQPQ